MYTTIMPCDIHIHTSMSTGYAITPGASNQATPDAARYSRFLNLGHAEYICIHMYTYICNIYIYIYMYTSISLSLCMYVCVYIYIYIHICCRCPADSWKV